MDDFNLDDFLVSYVPKDSDKIIKNYLKNKKLKDYAVLTTEVYSDMIIGKTYIKYIDKKFSSNLKIHHGGILISGGYYAKNMYVSSYETEKWTHLTLKSNDIDGNDYLFVVSLDKHHFFYKLFKEVIADSDFRKIIISLVSENTID